MIFAGGFPEAIRLEGKFRKNWHTDYVDALIEHDLRDAANIRRTDVMKDTGMVVTLLYWKPSDFAGDTDKPARPLKPLSTVNRPPRIDAAENGFHLYQYRDRDRREIDFLIERDDRNILALEVKSGITVRSGDFKHIEWFRSHLTGRPVIGVVLYAGDDILPFGKNLWAVPAD